MPVTGQAGIVLGKERNEYLTIPMQLEYMNLDIKNRFSRGYCSPISFSAFISKSPFFFYLIFVTTNTRRPPLSVCPHNPVLMARLIKEGH